MRKNKLSIVLICHAEMGLGGNWNEYNEVHHRMLDIFKQVEDETGKSVKTTFCVTHEMISDKLYDVIQLVDMGHEVGVHSHIPGSHRHAHRYSDEYSLRFDDDCILNQDKMSLSIKDIIMAHGLPEPKTHVSGMFSFHGKTLKILNEYGFSVDCSLIPNGKIITHKVTGDFVIADNSRRIDRNAYVASLDNPWASGNSKMVEIPVSGNLGCAYFEMDWSNSLNDELINIDKICENIKSPLVYQSYWHHFEFSRLHNWTKGNLDDAKSFLLKCAMNENVQFSTAIEAGEMIRNYYDGAQQGDAPEPASPAR